jgi:hypothetical protein
MKKENIKNTIIEKKKYYLSSKRTNGLVFSASVVVPAGVILNHAAAQRQDYLVSQWRWLNVKTSIIS